MYSLFGLGAKFGARRHAFVAKNGGIMRVSGVTGVGLPDRCRDSEVARMAENGRTEESKGHRQTAPASPFFTLRRAGVRPGAQPQNLREKNRA